MKKFKQTRETNGMKVLTGEGCWEGDVLKSEEEV